MNKTPQTLIYLCDVSSFPKESFDERYRLVNPERQKDILKYDDMNDRLLSLCGGLLLDQCIKDKDLNADIRHDENGKPFVEGHPEIFVSLTHCFPYVAAMISADPCGLDIERRDLDLEGIVRHYFNDKEKAYADNQDRITDIWCRKECHIKYNKPCDVRYIDTFNIPEDYEYISLPIENYSFEALKKKGEYAFQIIKF